MADLQNTKKDFLFNINHVGIDNVKHPIEIDSSLKPYTQTTIGTFKMTSSIKKNHKGTNMSRFTEMIQDYSKGNPFQVSIASLKQFTKDMAERLEQEDNQITISLHWFLERKDTSS